MSAKTNDKITDYLNQGKIEPMKKGRFPQSFIVAAIAQHKSLNKNADKRNHHFRVLHIWLLYSNFAYKN